MVPTNSALPFDPVRQDARQPPPHSPATLLFGDAKRVQLLPPVAQSHREWVVHTLSGPTRDLARIGDWVCLTETKPWDLLFPPPEHVALAQLGTIVPHSKWCPKGSEWTSFLALDATTGNTIIAHFPDSLVDLTDLFVTPYTGPTWKDIPPEKETEIINDFMQKLKAPGMEITVHIEESTIRDTEPTYDVWDYLNLGHLDLINF
ncbi:hypothetical protein H0H92_000467 [Tricholoma furcatifolium]|nr:hypothetical protein H0H92_000467 [Tricholoma furcatifolium]